MRFLLGVGAAVVLATATACGGGIVDPSKNQTENFSGTLAVGGLNSHAFTATKSGEYFISITKLDPPLPSSNATVLIAFVQGSASQCSTTPIQSNSFARLGQALSGSIVAGQYCVIIADVGFLQTATAYTIQVQHP